MASHHRQMTNGQSLTVNGWPQSAPKMNLVQNSVLLLPTQIISSQLKGSLIVLLLQIKFDKFATLA